jgi:hypothetical protein
MTRNHLASAARVASAALAIGGAALAQGVGGSPPVCNNNGPYVAECTGQQTPVAVTSAGSFDPDMTSVTFLWFEECPWGFFDDPTNPTPNMVIDLLGGCIQTCVFELRVFSGGEVTKCVSTVTVQDTTAPLITCPADFVDIWAGGIPAGQTDPTNTGFATAIDCDPNPVITYDDISIVPNSLTNPSAPEVVITREWTATDYCLNESTCIQIITLLSPSSALGGLLDVAPGSCSNEISVAATEGLFTVVLLGTPQFDVTQIDRATIELRRSDNAGTAAVRAATKLADKGKPGDAANPHCSSPLKDGRLDMQLSFGQAEVSESLYIAKETAGTQVEFAVIGRMLDGRWFVLRDGVTLVP